LCARLDKVLQINNNLDGYEFDKDKGVSSRRVTSTDYGQHTLHYGVKESVIIKKNIIVEKTKERWRGKRCVEIFPRNLPKNWWIWNNHIDGWILETSREKQEVQ